MSTFSRLKRAVLFVLFLVQGLATLSPVSHGKPVSTDLDLKTGYQLKPEPLTTEKVWILDPDQLNPHRQRWILSRHVELIGLKAPKRSSGKYGVQASGILSTAAGYVRGPGPWYRSWNEFRCERTPQDEFATEDGTKRTVSQAAEIWRTLLGQEKFKLSLLLKRISARTGESAMEQGILVFRGWLKTVESEWRTAAASQARADEWKSYLKEAAGTPVCGKKASAPNGVSWSSMPSTPWSSMMEPLSGEAPSITKILARAPARLWNGIFSIRVDVSVGGKILNGRFLIDSTVDTSILSPSWLENQGILPTWLEIRGAPLKRVSPSNHLSIDEGLAKPARVENVEVSGLPIPLKEFLLAEVDSFEPPEFLGSCCDGILGMDFLRLFPIEFQSRAPAEVRIWPRENFHWDAPAPWIELSEVPSTGLVSSCQIGPEQASGSGAPSEPRSTQTRWETGSDLALEFPVQKPKKPLAGSSQPLQIQCGSQNFARGVSAVAIESPRNKVGAGVGMPLLSRGNFTLDIPHGRIWFTPEGIAKDAPRANRSGLELEFVLRGGDRVLEVKEIQKGSPAASLLKEGLKPGKTILQMDSKEPGDIDLWEVNRRLAGDYGEMVSLQWSTKKGLKMAPLRVGVGTR